MTWQDLPGWFDYPDVYSAALESVPDGGVIVEVGAWMGRSAAFMAQQIRDSGRNVTFWVVDHGFGNDDKAAYACSPGLADNGGNIAGRLVSNLRECGVLDWVYPLITTSVRAARLFADESLDFVYIDGCHRRDAVLADLAAWWPKIKPGGMLAGHDYSQEHWPEVVGAVDEFFGCPCPHSGSVMSWSRTK